MNQEVLAVLDKETANLMEKEKALEEKVQMFEIKLCNKTQEFVLLKDSIVNTFSTTNLRLEHK